ncbi:hypothetical protein ABT063_28010 [Streptomyces sp. NPDC002838]|uniref:hypothetical protein n=1 Tax=Streptomyces sp. NPDC002838 TaxID=3154436 RepID=UPI003330C55D
MAGDPHGVVGVGDGQGLLRGRRVRVAAAGRGTASAPRYAEMWLPGADGATARCAPTARRRSNL